MFQLILFSSDPGSSESHEVYKLYLCSLQLIKDIHNYNSRYLPYSARYICQIGANCMLGNFACFLLSADFFSKLLFQNILSRIPSECQTVWIQIRPDIQSGLI